MRVPTPTIVLILAMLAGPSCAQHRRLNSGNGQNALMVNGGVAEAQLSNIGGEAMVESIIPTSATPITARPTPPPPPAMPAKPILPIIVLLYSSSPGPKECRGTPIFSLNVPKGAGIVTPPGPTCYNVTSAPQAECGTFMANMEDGCQARIFSEPACTSLANIAVFMDTLRPVGGIIRSIEVQCGIKSAQPAPLALNLPNVQHPAKKPAGR